MISLVRVINLIKIVYKYIFAIWCLIIIVSLLLAPEILFLLLTYFVAPFLLLLSNLIPSMPVITFFPASYITVTVMETILIILILFSSIISLGKLIITIVVKCLRR